MENYYTDEYGELQESNFYDTLCDIRRKKVGAVLKLPS